MKAITLHKYGNSDNLKLSDIPTPSPKENEVLVKIRSTSVNDYDWCMMRGNPFIYRLMFGLFKPKQPIAGMELSGEVIKCGEKSSKFKVGDEVYGDISEHGFGTFAQYICINENALKLKPKSMSFEDAASLPHASMLAYQGLIKLGKIQENQSILINGAGGGVGTIALNIAKHNNANVTGVDTGSKLENMTRIGFDNVIDYKKQDYTQSNNTYDIIFDTKLMRSPLSIVKALNDNGHYITVGGDLTRLLQTLIYKPFIKLFTKKTFSILALKANIDLDKIEDLYNIGVIKPEIDGPYPLEKTPELIQYFGEGKHTGKIIINIQHNT